MKNILVLLTFLMASAAFAVDLPEGGDAIFHQLRNSNMVAIAELENRDRKFLKFSLVKAIIGKPAKKFKVSKFKNHYGMGVKMVLGRRYLLFLGNNPITEAAAKKTEVQKAVKRTVQTKAAAKERIKKAGLPIYSLAMRGYSVQPVRSVDIKSLRAVILDYQKNLKNPSRLKNKLMAHNLKRVPYIQYSTVIDLHVKNMLGESEVRILANRMKFGTLIDPRAKVKVIQKITQFNLQRYSATLEKLILNNRENISVRAASITSLDKMGNKAALRRVAPAVMELRSGRLRRITRDIIKPRN